MKGTLHETAGVNTIPVLGATTPMTSTMSGNTAPVASGCVRWCMNVALQSFAGEPWAVQIRPVQDGAFENSMSPPGKHHIGSTGSPTSFHGKTTTQVTALENHRSSTANNNNINNAAPTNTTTNNADASSLGAGSSVTSNTPTTQSGNASSTSVSAHEGLRSSESLGAPRRRSVEAADGSAGPAGSGGATGTTVTFGEGFGSVPGTDSAMSALEHVTAAERCGIQLCAVDYDDLHDSSDGSEHATGSPNHPFPTPNEELEALRECVQTVNDPPVTYGTDELLSRIANVEFIPSETPTPEGLLQYCLHSSLEPVLHATLQPAVTAVVDHCVSSMVLVYGATQEMKQMGLIGTPEECGLLPHGIRMFMDRFMERREHQQQNPGGVTPSGGVSATATHPHVQGAEDVNRAGPSTTTSGAGYPAGTSSSGTANTGANFVFPSIGSSAHRFTRIEASFIAFDAVNVVDLLDLSNKHIELVLRLAPPPTPSEFEDAGLDSGSGRPHRPTTDSFVLNARVTPAESTNDALSALDVGLENLARALEAAMFQSESGSSLLFSLTAYTDGCRCATFHVLCLAEDPAAQTWLASTILARSQAIPLGEEQSWASIQNTPMPPPLHHHAATILVPALCFGNMFTSVLICVYNSMTALGRLNRDLTLAVTGYRMRTIPRVTSATTRRSTKKLPTGWEEHFTEDGRRYFTDTSTQLSTWSDPRLTPGYQQQNHRGSTAGAGASGKGGSSAASAGSPGSTGSAKKASSANGAGSASAAGQSDDGSAAAPCGEGSSAYAANAAPQQPRRNRVGLGQGDRDFLTRAIQQPTDSAVSTASTASADVVAGPLNNAVNAIVSGVGPDAAEGEIPSVDVGIVVIDTECRPRVVLSSQNPDFIVQYTREQEALSQEKARRIEQLQRQHQQQQQHHEPHSPHPEQPPQLQETRHQEVTCAPAGGGGGCGGADDGMNTPATSEVSPAVKQSVGNSTNSSVANPVADTSTCSLTNNTQGGPAQPNGPSSATTASTPEGTENGSAVALPSLTGLPRTHSETDVRTAPLATTAAVSPHRSGGLVAQAVADADDVGDHPFASVMSSESDRPPLDPRRLALNPDLDDDDDDDDAFALSRSDATSIDDFVFEDDSDEEGFASATCTPADDTVTNARRFYQNAMQEQMAMPLEEARGTSVVGTPLGTQSPASGNGGGSPGSPGSGTTPASVAISPDMQDLESLVEEFSKFFAQAYQAEEDVKRLQDEVARLKRYVRRLKRASQQSEQQLLAQRQQHPSPRQMPPSRPPQTSSRLTSPATTLTSPSSAPLGEGSDRGEALGQHRLCAKERGQTAPASSSPVHAAHASTAVPVSASSHILYAPTLLSDAQSLILLRTNESMRTRLEPVLTSLAAHTAAMAMPLATDAEGTLTESSSISHPTRSPVSRVTSPAGASVRSFAAAAESGGGGGGGGGDRAVLLAVLDAVLREWQASELHMDRFLGRS